MILIFSSLLYLLLGFSGPAFINVDGAKLGILSTLQQFRHYTAEINSEQHILIISA